MDEGAKRDGWLAHRGVFDASLFDKYAEAARHLQRAPRRPEHGDSTPDRTIAAGCRRSGKTGAANDVDRLRCAAGGWRNPNRGDHGSESRGGDGLPKIDG